MRFEKSFFLLASVIHGETIWRLSTPFVRRDFIKDHVVLMSQLMLGEQWFIHIAILQKKINEHFRF